MIEDGRCKDLPVVEQNPGDLPDQSLESQLKNEEEIDKTKVKETQIVD